MAIIYQFPIKNIEMDLTQEVLPPRYVMKPFPGKWLKQAACSEEEKKELIPLFVELLSLHHSFDDEGMSALEQEYDQLVHPFLKEAVLNVLDGKAAGKLDRMMLREIRIRGASGRILLEYMMIRLGVLNMILENHPTTTHQLLTNLLDFENPACLLNRVMQVLLDNTGEIPGEILPFDSCPLP